MKPRVNPLGLSAAAKKNRRKHLTASDAKRVMEGDWLALWQEKKGLIEPENLDDKLAVQMGSFSEPFNLFWCERQTGRQVDYFSDNLVCSRAWAALTGRDAKAEWQQSVEYLYMGCSLDAMSTVLAGDRCVLDAKHVGQYREVEVVERYTPAGTHQAVVMDVDYWALSIFVGNGRWEYVEQAVDPFYREELIEREREFWTWVEADEEPTDPRPEAPPKPTPKLRSIDASTVEIGSDHWKQMVALNNWLPDLFNEAAAFTETEGAHKAHVASRDAIKALLPEDVGLIRLDTPKGLFVGKRATNGNLSMKTEA